MTPREEFERLEGKRPDMLWQPGKAVGVRAVTVTTPPLMLNQQWKPFTRTKALVVLEVKDGQVEPVKKNEIFFYQ